MLKALIFDVDGTLAETEDLHRQAFNRAFQELGLDWNWSSEAYAELLRVMGGKERLRHYIAESHGGDEALLALMPEIHEAKTRLYGGLVEEGHLGLRPGVARLIAEARAAGVKLALATTTSLPNIDSLLGQNFEAGDRPFNVIAYGDEVDRKKPAPDIFTLALERLAIRPSEAVALEDSAAGIRSALDAGLAVLATRSVYTQSHKLDGAFSAVSDLGEPDAPHRHIAGHVWLRGHVDLRGLQDWLDERDRAA